jgi:hypothetical protein
MSTTISGTNGVTFPDSTSMQTGQQACKAWVSFNGQGTVAIKDGYNVGSITDNGAGDYTVNFATAFSDANYAGVVSASNESSAYPVTRIQDDISVLSTSCRLVPCRNTSGINIDTPYVSFVVFSN